MAQEWNTCRLYSDLAWLWPLWGGPADEYARYCAHAVGLIERYAQRPVATLLDIGCGGGKNIFNLKDHYRVTGLDLSPAMLNLARALNPTCELVEGDMRSFSLGRTFDAVLMDDAISYMTSRADLTAALQRAFDHLNPGGVMVVTPDVTTETFRQNHTVATGAVKTDATDSLDVVFVENVYDPNTTDEHYEGTFLFLIRENGTLRIETDRHRLGLFSLDLWRQTLSDVGFAAGESQYRENDDVYTVFACTKPAEG